MNSNIMEITERSCSGCGACVSICPKEAIQLKLDPAGFWTADVQEQMCIRCGLCRQVCNRFKKYKGRGSLYNSRLYALQSSSKETIKNSSSGGIAHELALLAIRKKYKVIGAVYNLDTNQVMHEIANTDDGIRYFDGSKYLQSNPASAFREAILEAKTDKENCFYVFGTPCQIAGMDKVLRYYKIRDQFLLIEIFCHGVPSYKLWETTCRKIEKKLGVNRFDSVQFRYKKNDWHTYCLKVEANEEKYYGARETELFWQVFFENILLGDACYECQERKEMTSADLRIGDYWGPRFQDHTDGVSAVFACTYEGKTVIEELICESRFRVLKESDAADMLAAQNMSGYTQKKLHNDAMNVLRKSGNIREAVRYYRHRQSGKQKLKRILLLTSAIIPDRVRSRIRKANSSRILKK